MDYPTSVYPSKDNVYYYCYKKYPPNIFNKQKWLNNCMDAYDNYIQKIRDGYESHIKQLETELRKKKLE